MSKWGNPEISMSKTWEKFKSSLRPNSGFDERILADSLAEYRNSEERSSAASPHPGKTIRFFPFVKWASIPIIAAGLILLLNPFEGSSVAWGKVADRIDLAHTLILRSQNFWRRGDIEFRPFQVEGITYASKEFGGRTDTMMNGTIIRQSFLSPDLKTSTTIDLRTGEMTQSPVPAMQHSLFDDPKYLIKEFLSQPHIAIGKDRINGVEAEGIEIPADWVVKDKKRYAGEKQYRRLWADIKTGLPVRLETKGSPWDGEHVMIIDFEWDKPLPQSLFQIPDLKKMPEKK